MKQLKIATRLYLIIGLSVLSAVIAVGLLVLQIDQISDNYKEILSRQVRHQDQARIMQVDLKEQVQAAKNLLLRGADPRDLKQYRDEFFQQEALIQRHGIELRQAVESPEVRTLLSEFLAEHQRIGQTYRAAFDSFVKTGCTDPKPADRECRGLDLAVTDRVDLVVSGIERHAEQQHNQLTAAVHRRELLVFLAAGGTVVLGGAICVLIARGMLRPLREAVEILHRVEAGDLTVRAANPSGDEVGLMMTALNQALGRIQEAVVSARRNAVTLAHSSEELAASSRQMSDNAAGTSSEVGSASTAAEQISANMQSVSAAVEEMGASIREIAKNSSEAARVATHSVEVARTTTAAMTRLGESSSDIGKIIKVISGIAEQTNLLALNAAIEAARAGDAGRGFAVVANEVKELAKETTRASADISRKIEGIQLSTHEALAAIAQVGAIIQQIHDFQTTIASAVEEQTSTTGEISRNVSEAARGTSEIASMIHGVARLAQDTNQGAGHSLDAAQSLARMASELEALMGQFTTDASPAPAPVPLPARESRPALNGHHDRFRGNGVPARAKG